MLFENKREFFFDFSIVILALTLHSALDKASSDFFTPFWKMLFGEDKLNFSIYGVEFSLYSILGFGSVLGILIGILYAIKNNFKVLKEKKKKKVEEIEIPIQEIEKIVENKMKSNFVQNPRQPGPSKENGNEFDALMTNRMFQPVIQQDYLY